MSDIEDLLAILNAHGQSFIQSFDIPTPGPSNKRKHVEEEAPESEEDEWTGITPEGEDEDEENSEVGEYDSGTPIHRSS